MLKEIQGKDLRIGMYVSLSKNWLEHGFLSNQFTITSSEQLEKFAAADIQFVNIDTDKGCDVEDEKSADRTRPVGSAVKPLIPDAIKSEVLVAALHDVSQPPQKKAETVHLHSLTMMKNLLEQPAPDNIKKAKAAFAEVVDLMFSDGQTQNYLMRITSHDFTTYAHSVTVGLLAVSLAKDYFRKEDGHDMHELGAGFFLHDLGKVKIDLDIINKPGRLTDEEMRSMRHHPTFGYKMLKESEQLSHECKLIVLQHHERFDGKGYPLSLKGSEIHDYGQICAIADIYEALTSVRPYKRKMAPFDALMLMKNEMSGYFHKKLFECFVLMLMKLQ